jgi:hypothetical protein
VTPWSDGEFVELCRIPHCYIHCTCIYVTLKSPGAARPYGFLCLDYRSAHINPSVSITFSNHIFVVRAFLGMAVITDYGLVSILELTYGLTSIIRRNIMSSQSASSNCDPAVDEK